MLNPKNRVFETIFPGIDDLEVELSPDQKRIREATMGYVDASTDNIATDLLLDFDAWELSLVHRHVETNPLPKHIESNLTNFVAGYDGIDPMRLSKKAQATVREEIMISTQYLELLQSLDAVPLLARPKKGHHYATALDTDSSYWDIFLIGKEAKQEAASITELLALLDTFVALTPTEQDRELAEKFLTRQR